MLLHGFQQRALRFWRGAVDFVRQHDVAENRTGTERVYRVALLVLLQHVGAGDVGGHEIRRELNPGEGQGKHATQRTDQTRFADSRHALQQHVAARDHRDHRQLHDILLTDDIAPHLLKNRFALVGKQPHPLR